MKVVNTMSTEIAAKKPATKIKLQERILRVWFHDIGWNYIMKLISSMKSGCMSGIGTRGGATKH